jgi:hypothetical protein
MPMSRSNLPSIQQEADRKVQIVDREQLQALVRKTRDMIDQVESAPEAVVLVRRASATEKLVAEALKTCQLLQEQQFQLKQDMAEAHLRTQRRAGELLLELKRHPGGRPKTASNVEEVSSPPLTLRELGVSVQDSHRWQRLASMPIEVFDQYVSTRRDAQRELTTAGALAAARQFKSEIATDKLDEEKPVSAGSSSYRKMRDALSTILASDPLQIGQVMRLPENADDLGLVKQIQRWLEALEQALEGPANAC